MQKAQTTTSAFNELSAKIKTAEKRMDEISVLKTHIINYAKTRDVYTSYRKAGYSKRFYEEHTSDLLLHKAAKAAFDELQMKKLPTVKTLQAELRRRRSHYHKVVFKWGLGILPNKHICQKFRQGILSKITRCVPPCPACQISTSEKYCYNTTFTELA